MPRPFSRCEQLLHVRVGSRVGRNEYHQGRYGIFPLVTAWNMNSTRISSASWRQLKKNAVVNNKELDPDVKCYSSPPSAVN